MTSGIYQGKRFESFEWQRDLWEKLYVEEKEGRSKTQSLVPSGNFMCASPSAADLIRAA